MKQLLVLSMSTRGLRGTVTAAVLLSVSMVVGCDASTSGGMIDPDKITPKQLAERNEVLKKTAYSTLDRALRDALKDPGSIQTRNVTHYTKSGELNGKVWHFTHSLCGELNAKNSYGGYVGYRRFVASVLVSPLDGEPDLTTLSVDIEDPDSEGKRQIFDGVAKKRCQDVVEKIKPRSAD